MLFQGRGNLAVYVCMGMVNQDMCLWALTVTHSSPAVLEPGLQVCRRSWVSCGIFSAGVGLTMIAYCRLEP